MTPPDVQSHPERDADALMRESEQRYRSVVAALREGVVVHDAQGQVVACNESALEIMGTPAGAPVPEKLPVAYFEDGTLITAETAPTMVTLRTGAPAKDVIARIERPDGSQVWVAYNNTPLWREGDEKPYGVVTSITDITDYKRAEQDLREERDRAQRYLDVAGTMIVVIDASGRVSLVNRKGCKVLGRREEEIVGADWFDLAGVGGDGQAGSASREAARREFERIVTGRTIPAAETESMIRTATGEERIIAWHQTLLQAGDSSAARLLVSGEDITERRRSEQHITYLAYHDALTGLPNRTLLEEHVKRALIRTRRAGTSVALLHLNVDNFRLVNDSLGHTAGDHILCRIAVRLADATRETDVLARVAGDEFALLLADVPANPVAAAELVANHITAAFSEPFALEGIEFQIAATFGIAVSSPGLYDPEVLLRDAESALHEAKYDARGGWIVASPERRCNTPERLTMTSKMRRALEREEFELHYQPIFALPDNELVAVEGLLRWRDPERGLVPPFEFIPLAEETGFIEQLGDWVALAACRQQVAWARRGWEPQISFNVSPRQLRRTDFVSRLGEHLTATGASPDRLCVELTESSTLRDPSRAEPILAALHALGLRLAIDDFGSGYSSLSRLREMPVETLKIDRSFLREVPESHEAKVIVEAIIGLARALDRQVVAEGVETEAQRQFLVAQRCQLVQGFLLARPMPAEQVEKLLARAATLA